MLLRLFRKLFWNVYNISHTCRTFQTFTMRSKIKIFISLISFLDCFYSCLGSFLVKYVLSRTHLAYILHTSRTHLAYILHILNFYYIFQNQISTSLKFFGVSKINFLHLLSSLDCFYACLGSLLGIYVLSRTHLVHSKILLCSKIKFFEVLLHMFNLGSLLCTYVLSRTFQTFTMHSKIEFLPLLSSLECFYACLRKPFRYLCIISYTSRTLSKFLLCIPKSNFYLSQVIWRAFMHVYEAFSVHMYYLAHISHILNF